MLGPEVVCQAIAGILTDQLPDELSRRRVLLSADESDLPMPSVFSAEPSTTPIPLQQYPLIFTLETDARLTAAEPSAGGTWFKGSYDVALAVLAAGLNYTDSRTQCRRLLLAVRTVLLRGPLAYVDDIGESVQLQPSMLAEEYGESVDAQGGAVVGAVIRSTWLTREHLGYLHDVLGQAENIDPHLYRVGPDGLLVD